MLVEDAEAALEAFGQFYAALLAQQRYGDHVCLAAQPADANGSPELLVERGVDETAAITARWADDIANAVADRSSEGSILTALGGLELDLAPFAKIVEREILHGAMLGALDSEWEREHDEEIAPVRFAAELTEGAFSSLPYADAVRLFNDRKVLPKEAFDALQKGARRTAFTVAGMASQEMLTTTKAELARIVHLGRQRPVVGDDGIARKPGPDLRNFRQFAKERLESAGWTPANKSHVETIYRTNVVSAYASGRYVEMRQPAVLAALPYWQIRGVDDDRARPTHKAAFGIVLRADHPFWKHAYPPFGYNCLLPGTVVRGVFRGASRARYAGKAIELTTAKGRRLSVTANHPVLTTRGFVPARELREGDELVSYRDEPGVAPLGDRAKRDEHHAPATVEEVFGALAETGGPLFTRARSDDFHGEAKRFRGEVEVVGSYANLPREWEPAPGDELPELALEEANEAHLSAGTRSTALGAVLLPTASDPRLPTLSLHSAAVGLQRLPFQELRVAAPAQLDAVLTEDASEGRTRDAGLVGELLERGSGEVTRDQVRSVREFEFCGHVYDLQSSTGWYAAGSVVVSNCRCRVVARTIAWMKSNGMKLGPVPKDLPDPGFDSGTSKLISVPAAALEPPAVPTPTAPAKPVHPPWLHPVEAPPLAAPPVPALPPPPAPSPPPPPPRPLDVERERRLQQIEAEREAARRALQARREAAAHHQQQEQERAELERQAEENRKRLEAEQAEASRRDLERQEEARAAREAEERRREAEEAAQRKEAAERAKREEEARKRAAEQAARPPLKGLDEQHDELITQAFEKAGMRTLGKPAEVMRKLFGRTLSPEETRSLFGMSAVERGGATQGALEFAHGEVRLRVQAGPPGVYPTVDLQRTIMRDSKGKLVVSHDHLFLSKAEQGKGIGSAIIREQFEMYERLGVDRVELYPVQVGRYYWPKIGFEPSAKNLKTVKTAFAKWLRAEGVANAEKVASSARSARDIAFMQVGERRVGKEFLLSRHADDLGELSIKVKPGDPGYEALKRELAKPKAAPRPPPTQSLGVTRAAYGRGSRQFGELLANRPAELNGFSLYTGEHHRRINSQLREGRPSPIGDAIQRMLNLGIERGAAVRGQVYRGVVMTADDLAAYAPDAEVSMKGLLSTTIDEGRARTRYAIPPPNQEDLLKNERRVVMRINQRTAVPVNDVSSNPGEEELLMRHGSRFRVTAVSEKTDELGSYHEVELEEL